MSILSDSEKLRYHRHLLLEEVGESGQEKIKRARILVVGAGGLGCPAIQYLTATGVGHLTIMDDDVVDISNLQRQVFYGIKDLGKHKAIIASALMKSMNHKVDIEQVVIRASYKNALDIVAKHDLVIDCTDNFQARYVLSDACVLRDKPLVHASVYKTQGQLSVFNYHDGPSYRCLFPQPDNENLEQSPLSGIYSILPGIMGLMQANEALKIILGQGKVLSGQLLIYDVMSQQFNFLRIKKNPNNFIAENILKNF
ncbi:MAG: HesA/MoeB/ThiF family protein [Bacteroidales bacterium]|nr:HesA/MoeB/ThiF family protein [Bacteroidales bacterium]